jgi:hypothetical protein
MAFQDNKSLRINAVKWIEIITLRSLSKTNTQLVNELLNEKGKSATAEHPVEIRIYHHSVVETDLSIHIHWESKTGGQHKSPLGLRLSYALKDLGLLNHSVWVETGTLEFPLSYGNSKSRDVPPPDRKGSAGQAGPRLVAKESL